MREIEIATPYITLGQLLKKMQIASTGGEAKHIVASGAVEVNGVPEQRRGRKLYPGDRVSVHGETFVIRNA
ncbi:MAG: RNA-binding S4 domain-containing protein [Alicyclobacillaceae bacterium]|nr:RNA-binding S4 domain-containing protein [Alicyclobacillaceae bacterium]